MPSPNPDNNIDKKMKQARTVLQKYYQFPGFRKGQKQVIRSILQERDTLALMPTGAGKSLCFQIPALILPGLTLVISPLISLMKDQIDSLQQRGIPATCLNSSLSGKEIRKRIAALKKNNYQLLYIAPERLKTERFLHTLSGLKLGLVAVDEAHCISGWGHDFRPDYLKISQIFQRRISLIRPPVAAFTATATPWVKKDIKQSLKLKDPFVFSGDMERKNLHFSVKKVWNRCGFLINYLKKNKEKSGIIFTATRKKAEKINLFLLKRGFASAAYHAGLKDRIRSQIQDRFLKNQVRIMVGTSAFGMGIDKANVRFVVHFNLTADIESYYQQAGRAGRDGKPASCILLFSLKDYRKKKYLLQHRPIKPQLREYKVKKLKKVFDYCHTVDCLQHFIISYFSEKNLFIKGKYGHCSNCFSDSDEDKKNIFSWFFYFYRKILYFVINRYYK